MLFRSASPLHASRQLRSFLFIVVITLESFIISIVSLSRQLFLSLIVNEYPPEQSSCIEKLVEELDHNIEWGGVPPLGLIANLPIQTPWQGLLVCDNS